MPLDAVTLSALVEELRAEIVDLRIEKIHQPARDQIVMHLRGGRRLMLNGGANAPRIHLTQLPRENPTVPPMFCVLLRKHLTGARIASLTQLPYDRAVRMELDATDDLGFPRRRTLVLEAIGRRGNLILLDEDGRVIESLRRVDASSPDASRILSGLFYEPPASAPRVPLLTASREDLARSVRESAGDARLADVLLADYFGISPLISRELVYRAFGDWDRRVSECSEADLERFYSEIDVFSNNIKGKHFTPILLQKEGKPFDFSALPIAQYGAFVTQTRYPTFSALLDAFYETRERQERVQRRGAELIRAATTARDRVKRKLAMQEKDLAAAQDREEWRVCGDLLTANFYRMKKGDAALICENYYDPNSAEKTIPLDPLKTPQQNAEAYYKRYTKAKTAEAHLREQIEIARRDLAYLESVLQEISQAESEQDFLDVRAELRETGFLRRQGKKETEKPSKPRRYVTSGGFTVLVGRNNRQNDRLRKEANYRDLWFHAKKIHGSHVILVTQGETPSQSDLIEAAQLAAYYSHARESENVPVDFTQVRNVKKGADARPGMVVYSGEETLFVTPSLPQTEKG